MKSCVSFNYGRPALEVFNHGRSGGHHFPFVFLSAQLKKHLNTGAHLLPDNSLTAQREYDTAAGTTCAYLTDYSRIGRIVGVCWKLAG